MQHQYNMRSPAVKRLMKEAQELKDPTELFYAQPLDDNLFEWHFTIRGPGDTEFDGGVFHGRIVLPPDYPMKPPSIIILTPNGRFEVNKKICLSISGHHPESWQPSWSIRTTLLAIIGFMPTHGAGAIGSLDYSADERKVLSKRSLSWKCAICGNVSEILKPLTDASKETSQEAKELASQINFQGEKGDKSKGKANSTSATPSSSSPSSSSPPSVTNSSSQSAATAPITTSASAGAAPTTTTLPQMMFPSAMHPGGMPNMFPPMPPFLSPMAGQFPFPYRFPYPPLSKDSNGMPCNVMMPPFHNPFLPPMFPAGFTFPAAGNAENQQNSTNMAPSFPFPFMPAPAPPTVPASSNPTLVASSSPVTTTASSSSSQISSSSNKSPSTSSSPKTSTSPSTPSTSTTTTTTSNSQDPIQNGANGAISKHSKAPSTTSASVKSSEASTSSSDTSDTTKTMSAEESQKSSETAETNTTNESGLRHRSTSNSAGPSMASATSDRATAATQPTASSPSARAGHSRSTPSFMLMVILGVAILLLCLRRLYISSDSLPYPDYPH